jgi:hypothetical protein
MRRRECRFLSNYLAWGKEHGVDYATGMPHGINRLTIIGCIGF